MKFLNASLLAAFFAATITHAHAQEPTIAPFSHGTYAIVEGGWNATQPTNAFNGLRLNTNRIKLKQGWALSIAGGYKWSNGLRAEVEASYHRNSYRNLYTPTSNFLVSGRQVTGSIMANALYDVNTGTQFTPYFGGGVGVSIAWMKDLTLLAGGAGSPIVAFLNNESARVAYQGIIGVAIAVAPQFEILMDTRYRVSNGNTFEQPNVAGTLNKYSQYNIHEITVMTGFRYAF